MAEALKQQDALLIKTAFTKTDSTWITVLPESSPAALFEFPEAMKAARAEAQTLAQALVQPGHDAANALILPMLVKLLALREAWVTDDDAFEDPEEEAVPDTVYVMY